MQGQCQHLRAEASLARMGALAWEGYHG